MYQSRWLQALHSSGLELWLPLPLLGLVFLLGGGLVTDQMLSRKYTTAQQIRVDRQLKRAPAIAVLSITVNIDPVEGFSKVKVKTANSALKELEFEFPVTEFRQIEAAIAQELRLHPEDVRQLVRY